MKQHRTALIATIAYLSQPPVDMPADRKQYQALLASRLSKLLQEMTDDKNQSYRRRRGPRRDPD